MWFGGAARWFKLVRWYLNFFHVWAISVAVFLAYIYLYDRFSIKVFTPRFSGSVSLSEDWYILISAASGLGEPLVIAVHAALVSAVFFSFEESEGFSYIRHAFGMDRARVYLAKITASILLVSTSLIAAKVVMAAVWDYRMLAWFADFLYAAALTYVAAIVLSFYFVSIYSFWALVVRRAVYFLVGAFLEAYLMEGLFNGPLMLMPITFQTLRPFELPYVILRYWDRFAFALAHACAALLLQLRGEVKWR